ncbi:hypothetical protein [Lentzea terrae]|uniref:hypothetical protein n=1 Tax=Lentzea terrae TaxID=2200761 RepID=UPI000DD34CC7|nr:hypothetical protein [Lentzea terrae]
MDKIIVPFVLAPRMRFGFDTFCGHCPDCGVFVSSRTEQHGRQLTAGHTCRPEDVRTTAVVWTHDPDGEVTVLWGWDIKPDPGAAALCAYCQEVAPSSSGACPGAVAHAQTQVDRERREHGHAASAALVATPVCFPENMLRDEIARRLQRTAAEPVLFRANRKLRTMPALTESGADSRHWFYCPECGVSGHERATTFIAAQDLEAHRCDPARVQTVAAVWSEITGLPEVIVQIYREDPANPVHHQQAAIAQADTMRTEVGDIFRAGLFVVPADMSPEDALMEIETRLRERHDAWRKPVRRGEGGSGRPRPASARDTRPAPRLTPGRSDLPDQPTSSCVVSLQ